jgi:acyl carrier protein
MTKKKTLPEKLAVSPKLLRIIVDVMACDDTDVTPGAHLINTLDCDSLDLVEILMGVEEEYDIEISDEVAEKLETVQDYMDYLGKVGAQ